MIKRILGLIILLVLLNSIKIDAQDSVKPIYVPPVESVNYISNNLVFYQDIRYGSIPDSIADAASDRILDLYLPSNISKKKVPVFIFIHGGGFRNGHKGVVVIQELCQKIALKGYGVLSINYRLTLNSKKINAQGSVGTSKGIPDNGKFSDVVNIALNNATEDTQLVLKWIKRNSQKYNFTTRSVAVGGSSAGAMTALNLAYISKQNIIPVKAVIDMWGGMANAELIKQNAPPVLIYHGDNDQVVHVDYAYALKKQMDKIGNDKSILCILAGQGHAQYDVIINQKINEIISFLDNNLK